jgi:hypothetical protein
LARTRALKLINEEIIHLSYNGIISDVDARRWVKAALQEAARLADEVGEQQTGDVRYGAMLVAQRLRELG